MASKRKGNFWLIGISFLLSILLAEVLLRMVGFSHINFYHYDFYTGVAPLPNTEGWQQIEGRAFVRINSHGMHDNREITVEKPKGVFRVAVLGDSFAAATQVDVSKAFWRILEKRLQACDFAQGKRIEVLNFGVSGFSTAQELLALRHKAAAYEPDLVILAFLTLNDVRDNNKAIATEYVRPYFELRNGRLVEDDTFRESLSFKIRTSFLWDWFRRISNHLRVIQLANRSKEIIAQRLHSGLENMNPQLDLCDGYNAHVYQSNPPKEWKEAWRITEALISEIRRESERIGARFLLVTLSNPAQVHPDPERRRYCAKKLGEPDLFYPERRLQAFAEHEGIDAIFLAKSFAEYATQHRVFLHGFSNVGMGRGHWNERGHLLAAELIGKHMCAEAAGIKLTGGSPSSPQ